MENLPKALALFFYLSILMLLFAEWIHVRTKKNYQTPTPVIFVALEGLVVFSLFVIFL